MSKKLETLPFTKPRAKSPSFSSILLDSIYRSIDDDINTDIDVDADTSSHHHHLSSTNYNANASSTNHFYYTNHLNYDHNYAKHRRSKMRSDSTLALGLDTVDLRRAVMMDSCMERQQRQSQPCNLHLVHDHHDHDLLHEEIRVVRQKSVPIRSTPSDHNPTITSFSSKICPNLTPRSDYVPPSNRVQSRIFTKTKSRAMKLYGHLRKPKLPPQSPQVSPGGRIAAFLSSIFRNSGETPATRSNPSPSTCSSTSSFSRSCLSKTPLSRGKSSSTSTGSTKRSVRFYPISVMIGEGSRPCSNKSKSLISSNTNSNLNVDEKWKNQKKSRREKEIDALMMMIKRNCQDRTVHVNSNEEINDDDDDVESCASSDLFELENLSSIGIGRYSEELPVYGTTNLQNLTA